MSSEPTVPAAALDEQPAMPSHFFEPDEGTALYHYTSLAAAKGILEGRALWLSDFTRMNDPGEYAYARACFLENYRSRQAFLDMVPRLILTTALLGLEENTTMFIGCLSPDDRDAHQWQHHGANGRGCAIALDASILARHAGVAMRRVVYARSDFDEFTAAGICMLQTQFEDEPEDIAALQELARCFVSDLFAFKHPDFEREREIRMSRMLVRSEPGGPFLDFGGHDRYGAPLPALAVRLRQSPQGATSFIALPLETRAGRAIRSVTLGPAIAEAAPHELDSLLEAAGDVEVSHVSGA